MSDTCDPGADGKSRRRFVRRERCLVSRVIMVPCGAKEGHTKGLLLERMLEKLRMAGQEENLAGEDRGQG